MIFSAPNNDLKYHEHIRFTSNIPMACPRCVELPDAHSFTYFGKMNDISLYYTSPARAHDFKENAQTYSYYKNHVDSAKPGPWIWVIDCAGMKIKHYSSLEITRKLIQMLMAEHKGILQSIWIVHPNAWMRTTINVMKPFLKAETLSKIKLLEGERTELYVGLEKAGLSGRPLQWLNTVFVSPQVPGPLPPIS